MHKTKGKCKQKKKKGGFFVQSFSLAQEQVWLQHATCSMAGEQSLSPCIEAVLLKKKKKKYRKDAAAS